MMAKSIIDVELEDRLTKLRLREKNNTLDLVDLLLEEVKKGKVKSEERRQPVKTSLPIPDALVLLLITRRCKNCGATFGPTPNDTILYRFGGNLHFPEKWTDLFASLPREISTWEKTISYCPQCYETFPFSHLNMESKK